jgi:hypothetical protein
MLGPYILYSGALVVQRSSWPSSAMCAHRLSVSLLIHIFRFRRVCISLRVNIINTFNIYRTCDKNNNNYELKMIMIIWSPWITICQTIVRDRFRCIYILTRTRIAQYFNVSSKNFIIFNKLFFISITHISMISRSVIKNKMLVHFVMTSYTLLET